MDTAERRPSASPSLWTIMCLAAMAAGMGWGIRGQYGHETGAMIAGLLLGQVIVLLFCPNGPTVRLARAVALITAGVSFGGSMTYGQTVGLTHNPVVIGNASALAWGMTGLAIKGGVWIGFAGLFLGVGLSGKRYRPRDMFLLFIVLFLLYVSGIWLLNRPFEPSQQKLPLLYFSAHWNWEPTNPNLKPRLEGWGGLLLALIGALVYFGGVRKDRLAFRLGLWGVLGGALGFPLGQSIQASHAWYPHIYEQVLGETARIVNYWNVMETVFGATFGAIIGLGVWLNRNLIDVAEENPVEPLPFAVELVWTAIYVCILIFSSVLPQRYFIIFAEYGILLGMLPIALSVATRLWPFLYMLPMVCLPIAAKTLRELAYKNQVISETSGWWLYLILPFGLCVALSGWYYRTRHWPNSSCRFARQSLLFTVWLYFGLNFAFFRFPLPWQEWTGRTPNAIVFALCTLGLTVAALSFGRHDANRTTAMQSA